MLSSRATAMQGLPANACEQRDLRYSIGDYDS